MELSLEKGLETELSRIKRLASKVYPLVAPKSTPTPYVIYVSSQGRPVKSLAGFENLVETPIELNVIGGRYDEMKAFAAAVIGKLESFEGREIGGVYVQEVTYQEPAELYESAVNKHRCVIDARLYVER